MESPSSDEIIHDFPPFFKVHKDGRIERYMVGPFVPTGLDPETGVQTKDVVVSPETGVKARMFLPKLDNPTQKLPILVHYHGGGFCVGSPFDPVSLNFLKCLVAQARVMAISVDYRLAPENPLPVGYEDSWGGLQWVASHSDGRGSEPWINEHADLGRVFLAGESAGANIAHYVAVRAGVTGLGGLKVVGVLVVHPFFGGKDVDEMYKYLCPTSSGRDDDPELNPGVDPDLPRMAGEKVLVAVAEKDWLKSRGVAYYEALKKCGWGGSAELVENKGEDHCFHLFNPNSDNAKPLMKMLVDFLNLESSLV